MIRLLSNDSGSFLDRFLWYHLKCIVWVLSFVFWEASMLRHGAGIGYTGPGWAPLTISVWWLGRLVLIGTYTLCLIKVPTFKLAATLSNLHQFLNYFIARKLMKFATQMFNISHHTLLMLLHYLGKFKSPNLLQIKNANKMHWFLHAYI